MTFRVILPNGRTVEVSGEGLDPEPGVGWRVLVPTSSGGGITGVVLGRGRGTPRGRILSVPDRGPVVLPHHLELLEDLSKDYLVPKGVLLFKMLPSVFNWRQEEVVRVSDRKPVGLDPGSSALIDYVRRRKEVKLETLKKRFGSRLVNLLVDKGFLVKETKWIQPKRKSLYRLKVSLEDALRLVRDQKKRDLILKLIEAGTMSEDDLRDLGFSVRTVRSLVAKGILEEVEEEATGVGPSRVFEPVKEVSGRVTVLWGDLYEVVSKVVGTCVSADGSSLILSTGSDLIRTLIPSLRGVFGDRLVEIHGGVSGGRLFKCWFSCLEGGKVVVGTFPSLLAPLPDLKVVVLLDETGPGVKPPALGIDLRRAVAHLSRRTGSALILTSPAPSVTSYYLTVKKIATQRKLIPRRPEVFIFRRGSAEILTEDTLKILEGDRKVLFLVRKEGYSYAYCPRCESIVRCPICGTFLTLSRDTIYCTGCRKFRTKDLLCPECGGDVEDMGFGLDRAVEVVERTFGLKEGFNFSTYPRWGEVYDTVVVLSADGILSLPTFRSEEEFFLYLVRAYLCADKKFVVQTTVPDVGPLAAISKGNFEEFYRTELARREKEKLPPFYRLALIRSRRDLGAYIRKVVSPDVRTVPRIQEGVYDHLVRFRERETLRKIADLRRRFGKDIIEVRVDPF